MLAMDNLRKSYGFHILFEKEELKMEMKLKTVLIMVLISATMIFNCACAEENQSQAAEPENNTSKKTVTVTTTFLYDMAENLAGDHINLELVIPAGQDPHLYVAKPGDLKKIEKADMLFFHGLHFEGKMVEILEKTGKDVSRNFPKEKINDSPDEIGTPDPHFWFDLELYKKAVETMADDLTELLPENADEIKQNCDNYLKELDDLNDYIVERISEIGEDKRYLVTPHDAFNYFAKAYDFEVIAPQGVSTDSEVANSDIIETVNLIIEHQIKAIFAESTTDPARMVKLQEACRDKGFELKVVSGENAELFSDSLAPKGQAGDTFIDMYKHNIDLIVDNLK